MFILLVWSLCDDAVQQQHVHVSQHVILMKRPSVLLDVMRRRKIALIGCPETSIISSKRTSRNTHKTDGLNYTAAKVLNLAVA